MLRVSDVEDLPAELHFMVFVIGHGEGLTQPHVHGDIARDSEDVAVADLARNSVAEALIGEFRVGEEIRRRALLSRALFDISDSHAVALNVPVGRPLRRVEWRLHRNSRIPAEDAGQLPAAEDGIRIARKVAQEGPPFADRKLPYGIRVDDVTDVEIRHRAVLPEVQRVDDEGRAVCAAG